MEEQNVQTEEHSGGVKGFLCDLMDILEAAVLTVFIFLLLFAYVVRPVTVDGPSMNPTLLNEDKIIIVTALHHPKNGQIVVIDDQKAGLFADAEQQNVYESDGAGIVIIKRLIAHGGQEIDIDFDAKTVSVDGVVLDEPYIAEATSKDEGAFLYPFTVPEGYLFVMGDNRQRSMDSRSPSVALIPEEQVLGTALVRYGRNSENCSKFTDRFDYLF